MTLLLPIILIFVLAFMIERVLNQQAKKIKNLEDQQKLFDAIQDKHNERIEEIENTKHLI